MCRRSVDGGGEELGTDTRPGDEKKRVKFKFNRKPKNCIWYRRYLENATPVARLGKLPATDGLRDCDKMCRVNMKRVLKTDPNQN